MTLKNQNPDSLKPMRRRDEQQWILDWIVKTTGRVQNFEYEGRLLPAEVKSYRMIPRVLAKIAKRQEDIAREAEKAGHHVAAKELYMKAVDTYRNAQHCIFEDDNPEKIFLFNKMKECMDRVIELNPLPIERVEVPWEGKTIAALFYPLPDGRKAPTVLFIPGMDQTKECPVNPIDNPFTKRGMNVLVIDGPGQGESVMRKIKVTHDNYERAASACIDWLLTRPEVDAGAIAVNGVSMGSFWGIRTAAYDKRIKACATGAACYGGKRAIFQESGSPRFKQVFMYMSGIYDEEEFDKMAEKMTTRGYGSKITCPTLMATGEYDPLTPLEDAFELYEELAGPKEMWVFENDFHLIAGHATLEGLAGLDIYSAMADWTKDALAGKYGEGYKKIRLITKNVGLGQYDSSEREVFLPGRLF